MIKKYRLEGFYKYSGAPNGSGDLTGELEISENGSFESQITDHASRVPEQTIRGFLKRGEDKRLRPTDTLCFLKFPPRDNLANLAYSLRKDTIDFSDDSFEGHYHGRWGALPVKLEFNRDYNLFVARIDMDMCRIGDSAQITLYEK